MWPFVSGFFYLPCSQGSPVFSRVSALHSFVWLSTISLSGYTEFHLCSSVDGYVSCFHLLKTVKNAALNICVQVFVRTFVFNSLGAYTQEWNCFGNSVFDFLRTQ